MLFLPFIFPQVRKKASRFPYFFFYRTVCTYIITIVIGSYILNGRIPSLSLNWKWWRSYTMCICIWYGMLFYVWCFVVLCTSVCTFGKEEFGILCRTFWISVFKRMRKWMLASQNALQVMLLCILSIWCIISDDLFAWIMGRVCAKGFI